MVKKHNKNTTNTVRIIFKNSLLTTKPYKTTFFFCEKLTNRTYKLLYFFKKFVKLTQQLSSCFYILMRKLDY